MFFVIIYIYYILYTDLNNVYDQYLRRFVNILKLEDKEAIKDEEHSVGYHKALRICDAYKSTVQVRIFKITMAFVLHRYIFYKPSYK